MKKQLNHDAGGSAGDLNRGNLFVTVVDDRDQTIPTVTVSIPGRSGTTDPNGNCFFSDLAPGSYTAQASMDGFTSLPQTTQVHAGRTSTLVCIIRPTIN